MKQRQKMILKKAWNKKCNEKGNRQCVLIPFFMLLMVKLSLLISDRRP